MSKMAVNHNNEVSDDEESDEEDEESDTDAVSFDFEMQLTKLKESL